MAARAEIIAAQGLGEGTSHPERFKSHQEFENVIARGESTAP